MCVCVPAPEGSGAGRAAPRFPRRAALPGAVVRRPAAVEMRLASVERWLVARTGIAQDCLNAGAARRLQGLLGWDLPLDYLRRRALGVEAVLPPTLTFGRFLRVMSTSSPPSTPVCSVSVTLR